MAKLRFFGQEHCLIDRNGRVRLPTRMLADFQDIDQRQVVLHCLPENALAIYPLSTWQQMRSREPRPAAKAGSSLAYRRQLRRFGGFTQMDELSNQGRITVPPLFREPLSLLPGTASVIVGCEIGVEIWNAQIWQDEHRAITEHEQRRAQTDLEQELMEAGC